MSTSPAVWFPAVRTNTGADVFTERLCQELNARDIRAQITWLPHRAEYLPWTVPIPLPPEWANIVHVNTWLHSRFIPRELPVVATLHHSVHNPALQPYKGWLRMAYHRFWIAPNERRIMRRARKVVAVSQFAASMARKTLCNVPMDVIYNGIDTSLFHPASDAVAPHQPFQLLYVGGWKDLKGVDLLEPIMRELGGGVVLYYTGGSGAERDKLRLPSNMIDVGRLSGDRVVEAMQQADALLFPSRSEGFGLVAAEAMACGLPVVATRGSSLAEIVMDGKTGILCMQDDVSAFASAIRRLASDVAQWQMMSKKSVEHACTLFSGQVAINAYRDAYMSVLRNTPS